MHPETRARPFARAGSYWQPHDIKRALIRRCPDPRRAGRREGNRRDDGRVMKQDELLFWMSVVWLFALCGGAAWILSSPAL
jgi:hypothetical protein